MHVGGKNQHAHGLASDQVLDRFSVEVLIVTF